MLPSIKHFLKEFLIFGLKQANACLFAGAFFLLLFLSNHIPLFGLPRYDFLFLSAVLIQIALVVTKQETIDEVKVIFLFHIVGLCLEIFKTSPLIGSWSYPEFGYFKIATVPLYSGFMYAAVASYAMRAWKLFQFRLENYPPYLYSLPLSIFIYLNFFTHHFIFDFRYFLILAVLLVFWKTQVYFIVIEKTRKINLVLGFLLVAFFVWIAENISTYLGAWKYPDQIHAWNIVSTGKITSWFLLVIITFIIVADLKHFKELRRSSSYQ